MAVVDINSLARALNNEGLDALEAFVRSTLVPMILADLPVGDPAEDPDPGTSLAENLVVRREGLQIVVEIDTPYAAVQHYAFYQHPRGGRARFLEDNLQTVEKFVEGVIGAAVRQRLARL